MTTDAIFNLDKTHPSWHPCLKLALAKVDTHYLSTLKQNKLWLPGHEKIFNAFSLPLPEVRYVLFGESPYPRAESANGYAFWDNSVKELWSESGLSKKVNRATSLRNIIKMLLLAEGLLTPDKLTQPAIAQLNKQSLVQTNQELFTNFLHQGFLLLNATLVLNDNPPQIDAKAWYPFMQELLTCLLGKNPHVKFILLGRIASFIDQLLTPFAVEKFYAEHPYNLSFITNPKVCAFFKPLHLLKKTQ